MLTSSTPSRFKERSLHWQYDVRIVTQLGTSLVALVEIGHVAHRQYTTLTVNLTLPRPMAFVDDLDSLTGAGI